VDDSLISYRVLNLNPFQVDGSLQYLTAPNSSELFFASHNFNIAIAKILTADVDLSLGLFFSMDYSDPLHNAMRVLYQGAFMRRCDYTFVETF
jgi:hypothetical protein